MTKMDAVVFVIDDDPEVRGAIEMLIESVGIGVKTFESAQDFLQSKIPDSPSCLVLDVRLPGLSGLDLQHELTKRQIQIPIVFITGHGDVPLSVRAMKAGAVEFLTKPFRDQDLLDAVAQAIERDRTRRAERTEIEELRKRSDLLTAREREVMRLVVAGMLNKQIADELGASEATIKTHRAHVMQKMQAGSLPDLVRMADKLKTTISSLQDALHSPR